MPFDQPNTVADNLKVAKALIADPDDWCQGTFHVASGERHRRCSYDALHVAVCGWDYEGDPRHIDKTRELKLLGEAAAHAMGFQSYCDMDVPAGAICVANNTLDHRGVMKMFDRAIQLAGG